MCKYVCACMPVRLLAQSISSQITNYLPQITSFNCSVADLYRSDLIGGLYQSDYYIVLTVLLQAGARQSTNCITVLNIAGLC